MTEAEALDMAAEAAGWGRWGAALRSANRGVIEALRAHAKTIMALAKLMTTCEEATTRMELMYFEHRKVVDENAALKAENERLREAARPFAFAAKHAPTIQASPHDFVLTSEFHTLAAALERIDHGDR